MSTIAAPATPGAQRVGENGGHPTAQLYST